MFQRSRTSLTVHHKVNVGSSLTSLLFLHRPPFTCHILTCVSNAADPSNARQLSPNTPRRQKCPKDGTGGDTRLNTTVTYCRRLNVCSVLSGANVSRSACSLKGLACACVVLLMRDIQLCYRHHCNLLLPGLRPCSKVAAHTCHFALSSFLDGCCYRFVKCKTLLLKMFTG